ncbi:protein GAMETE EXPRESSED 3-like [Zingiber officinale]|uniref:protein GAMETE EXPRESSED 3-like n=1 Tax=Zingiber officinale TaxID=94328 RepID=UPI001C4C8474|nr:protein GAMETE EXPRESSED 3-like [Zingiber officinale]
MPNLEKIKAGVSFCGLNLEDIDRFWNKLMIANKSFEMLLRFLLLLLAPPSANAANSAEGRIRKSNRLGNPLMLTEDGKFLSCSGMNLICFEKNGSFAWIIPLQYKCRSDLAPIADDRGKIYLVAEDRVLRINPSNIGRPESTVEVFFGGNSGEILGISISCLYTSLFVAVRNRALFAVSLRGGEQLLWSAGPLLYRFGYRQGCKKNTTDCFFNSVPVVDQCEGTIYVSNTEGQIYSLFIRSPHFRWIQDFSSIDKMINIVPGNNGHLYLIFPRKATVMSLDVSTGTVSWQSNVGLLSSETIVPVVDSNGWLSIGSLDGFLYSFSPTGEFRKYLQNNAEDSVIMSSPVLDCSGFAVYVSQTIMEEKSTRTTGNYTFVSALKPTSMVITLLTPATGTVYWSESYHGEMSSLLPKSDLHSFDMDERIFLSILSAKRIGSSLPSYSAGQRIAWTCSQPNEQSSPIDEGDGESSSLFVFLLFQLVMLLILAGAVRFCCNLWRKKKLQDHGLVRFLDKRRSLHSQRRTLSSRISELEQEAAEGAANDEAIDQLGEIVRAKKGVERKLSTSYSLGSDRTGARRHGRSILPVYDGKGKSHSFHSTRRSESVTIFNTYSNTSSSSSSSSSSVDSVSINEEEEEAGPSQRVNEMEWNNGEGSSHTAASGGRTFTSQSFQGNWSERRMRLMRRRTLSSTN